MTYTESKNILDGIKSSNEVMFRMAISHLMDCGIKHLTTENIERTCKEIIQEDDSKHFMTNEFKCNLVKMTGELSKIDHIHLLTYISREVYYHVDDNCLSYRRLFKLAKGCIEWVLADAHETEFALQEIREMGFEDEDIECLGFGWMLETEEE